METIYNIATLIYKSIINNHIAEQDTNYDIKGVLSFLIIIFTITTFSLNLNHQLTFTAMGIGLIPLYPMKLLSLSLLTNLFKPDKYIRIFSIFLFTLVTIALLYFDSGYNSLILFIAFNIFIIILILNYVNYKNKDTSNGA